MSDQLIAIVTYIAQALQIIGAVVLILGFVVATYRYIRHILKNGMTPYLNAYRKALGRTVIIGLEILVAATIIKTITINQTMESFSLLVIMIAIRTFLSWTTTLEITGHWPWQEG